MEASNMDAVIIDLCKYNRQTKGAIVTEGKTAKIVWGLNPYGIF